MSNCSLSAVEGKLPPGFRFHPRDDELICDFLMKKLLLISPIAIHSSSGVDTAFALLIDVDLNKCEPWDLPEIACVGGKEWYFYSQRDRKYATGLRTNRATVSGYWKATGKDRAVVRKRSLVGMRKTLVFYQGRAPKGQKTDWVMHEFRLEGPFGPPKSSSSQEDWVLCRVFHKSRESLPPKPTPNGYDETGCSSLPALMDSYISFDHTDPPITTSAATPTPTNDDDDNKNEDSLANYQRVPCFSINNNITNPSHLFHAPPTDGGVPMGEYTTPPAFGNSLMFTGAMGDDMSSCDGSGDVSARERHVIKAVLSHLTNNMESSEPELRNGNDVMKGSSPSRISMGDETGGSNSESYLSDLMWTSHY